MHDVFSCQISSEDDLSAALKTIIGSDSSVLTFVLDVSRELVGPNVPIMRIKPGIGRPRPVQISHTANFAGADRCGSLLPACIESFNRDSQRSARRGADTRSSADIPAKI